MIDDGSIMSAVIISPKYQVVIPKAVRETMQLRPGQRVQVIEVDGIINLIPERPMEDMRGFAKGIDTTVEREDDRL